MQQMVQKTTHLTFRNYGKFELNGDNAAGMAATVTGLGTANKATIINKGVIETIGSNVDTTGIMAKRCLCSKWWKNKYRKEWCCNLHN